MKKLIILGFGLLITCLNAQDQTINGTTFKQDGKVGIGTPSANEKLELRGNLFLNSGTSQDAIYWSQHNLVMGTRPGIYSHNVFKLKPGGSPSGLLFSRFEMYNANSENSHEVKVVIHSNGNSFFNAGNFGIGTTTPNHKLDVNTGGGNFKTYTYGVEHTVNTTGGWARGFRLRNENDNKTAVFGSRDGSAYISTGFDINTDPIGYQNQKFTVLTNGNVGIGTIDTKGFKLGVNGKIAATEVKVATYTNWPDFVFKKNYELPTLKEVEQHIKENGHLKDIPSAEKVKEEGFFLGDMDSKLLQKIEELTLYTIEQEKKIKELSSLKKENELLHRKFDALEALVSKMIINNKN